MLGFRQVVVFLPELFFKLFAPGDVSGDAVEAVQRAVFFVNGPFGAQNRQGFAGRVGDGLFVRDRPVFFQNVPVVFFYRARFLFGEQKKVVFAERFRGGFSGDLLRGVIE